MHFKRKILSPDLILSEPTTIIMDSDLDWDNCSLSSISTSPSYYDNFPPLSDSEWDNCSLFPPSLSLPQNYNKVDDDDDYSYPPSLISWSSLLYEFLNGEILSRCTHCDWPPPSRDNLLAVHFERRDDYESPKVEQEDYSDLRSAARSRRMRRRQDRRRCHSYRCRKEGQACADRRNTKRRREVEREAGLEVRERMGILAEVIVWA